jgi:hypothetical protein
VAAAALSANDAAGGKHRKGSELKYVSHILRVSIVLVCVSVLCAVLQILWWCLFW